jgi:hypothetical protein
MSDNKTIAQGSSSPNFVAATLEVSESAVDVNYAINALRCDTQELTGITGTGAQTTVSRLRTGASHFAIRVVGEGAAPTAWEVSLEGSLDGTNFSKILVHSGVDVTVNGQVVPAAANGEIRWSTVPTVVRAWRANVVSRTLGSATAITIQIVAK